MEVLDQQQRFALARQAQHVPAQDTENAVAPLVCPRAGRRVGVRRDRDVEQRRERGRAAPHAMRRAEGGAKLAPFVFRRVLGADARDALQCIDHRVKRAVLVVGRTLQPAHPCPVRDRPANQHGGQRGLAHARFADDADGLGHTGRSELAVLLQARQVDVPSDDRVVRGMRCKPPALRRLERMERGNGLAGTFEEVRAGRGKFDGAGAQPPRRFGHHHTAGPGQRLQPSGQIGRLADDGVGLARFLAHDVAHHHEPAGDAHAHLDRLAVRLRQCRDGPDQFQGATHGSRGVILLGLRVAKVIEHAVADEAGDGPAVAPRHAGASVLVAPDDFSRILGIEAFRKGARPDDVGEHDGQVAPLTRVERRLRQRRRILQRRDRIQDPAHVPHRRHADVAQVLGRQPRQHLPVDVVGGKRARVPAQPEPDQESGDLVRTGRIAHGLLLTWIYRSTTIGPPGDGARTAPSRGLRLCENSK
jgi:hypothetical protein